MNKQLLIIGLISLAVATLIMFNVDDVYSYAEKGDVPCYDKYNNIIPDTTCYGYDLETQRKLFENGFIALFLALLYFFGGGMTFFGLLMDEEVPNSDVSRNEVNNE